MAIPAFGLGAFRLKDDVVISSVRLVEFISQCFDSTVLQPPIVVRFRDIR